ncbi:hypothetical protein GCM10027051_29890 [Niabella terrae]
MPRPTYEVLKSHYPNLPAAEVYKLIGGTVYKLYQENPVAYANACALRLSRAFNYGGVPIVASSGYYMQRGADKKPYIFRVREIIQFINEHFSKPDYTFSKTNNGSIQRRRKNHAAVEVFTDYLAAMNGLKGIIVFRVSGWGDASGHCTLFSATNSGNLQNKCEDNHCYFEHEQPGVRTDKIELWSLQ